MDILQGYSKGRRAQQFAANVAGVAIHGPDSLHDLEEKAAEISPGKSWCANGSRSRCKPGDRRVSTPVPQ